MPRGRVRPLAEANVAEAADWYEAQESGLGPQFVAAIDIVFAQTPTILPPSLSSIVGFAVPLFGASPMQCITACSKTQQRSSRAPTSGVIRESGAAGMPNTILTRQLSSGRSTP